MRKLIVGLPGTILLFTFILIGIGFILFELNNDSYELLGIPGIIFLFLAAVIRVLKDVFRRQQA